MNMIKSDGNGGYIIKKVVVHTITGVVTLIFTVLGWYIITEKTNALETIRINSGRITKLEKIIPVIGNDVETILVNQRRWAERNGLIFIEPQMPSNRYNLRGEKE